LKISKGSKENVLLKLTIRNYLDTDWLVTCNIHDQARLIELIGSCDARAFVPLAEDKPDILAFKRSIKHVACIEDKVVGFVGTDKAEVSWLYVDPCFQGQGVGRQLLEHGLAVIDAKAATYVLEGNSIARKLYESAGFKVVQQFDSNNNGYACSVLRLMQ